MKFIVRSLDDLNLVLFSGSYEQCRDWAAAHPPKEGHGYETSLLETAELSIDWPKSVACNNS